MPETFKDRPTVVLTGASRGIGHATVIRFAAEGFRRNGNDVKYRSRKNCRN